MLSRTIILRIIIKNICINFEKNNLLNDEKLKMSLFTFEKKISLYNHTP